MTRKHSIPNIFVRELRSPAIMDMNDAWGQQFTIIIVYFLFVSLRERTNRKNIFDFIDRCGDGTENQQIQMNSNYSICLNSAFCSSFLTIKQSICTLSTFCGRFKFNMRTRFLINWNWYRLDRGSKCFSLCANALTRLVNFESDCEWVAAEESENEIDSLSVEKMSACRK